MIIDVHKLVTRLYLAKGKQISPSSTRYAMTSMRDCIFGVENDVAFLSVQADVDLTYPLSD